MFQQPIQPASAGPEEQALPSGKKYTVEALERASSETRFSASFAQVLFQAWYGENLALSDGDVTMPDAQAGIDKTLRIAEEFRKKIHAMEFDKREDYDKSIRARYQKDGKTIIHLPDAGLVAPHFPRGSIPGID